MPVSTLPSTTPYLRRLESGLLVPATTGKRTFVSERAKFTAGFDRDFESYSTNVPSDPAPAVVSDLYETSNYSGNFRDQLGSLGLDLNLLFWSQDQTLSWIETHPQHLHPEGWATFLPFMVGGNRLVANVLRYGSLLHVFCYRFNNDLVRYAVCRHRWVIPHP